MTVAAALEDLDLSAVFAALHDQEERGHTAATDAERPLEHFAAQLIERSIEAADVMRRGDRRNLNVAYRRCAREAALALVTMRRIRLEQSKEH